MIKLLDEKVISDHGRSPRAMFFRNGEILIHVGRIDQPVGILHSRDHGQSWGEETSDGSWPGGYIQLPDGSVMVVITHNAVWGKFNPKQPYLPFIAQVRKAKSPADLLTGNFTDDFVKVEVPDMACLYGDDGQFGCGVIDHGLIELENGDFLLTMYGVFKNDNIPVPYFTQPSFQNRSWVCRSKDRGRTWHYLSTIASAMDFKLPPLAEGFSEADMIKTDDGGLLSVMRTGGNPGGKGTERFTPIYACTSMDNGVTWSQPREIHPFGVWPKLAKMSDGTLVCSSGRPGNFLLLSTDNGKTWSPPLVITDHYAEWRMCSSGLTSIGEIEPGKLAIFYDDVIVHKDGRVSHPTKMRVYQISG